jgi:hypothetical protein
VKRIAESVLKWLLIWALIVWTAVWLAPPVPTVEAPGMELSMEEPDE